MKTLSFFILFVVSLQANAQLAKPNVISHADYGKISIEGIALEKITSTNGQEASVKALYKSADLQRASTNGTENNADNLVHSGSYYVLDKKVRLSFSSGFDVEGGLTSIEILSKDVSLTICGVKFRLGESIEKLSRFHKNEKYQNFLFIPESDQDRVFSIRYDRETKKITEVSFYVLT